MLQVDDIFVSFEAEPLGAASLAQVHKATLKDGSVVAVKVQHPRVKAHSYIDIKTMEVMLCRHSMQECFYVVLLLFLS